jgi:hypothetical protein
VTGRIYVLFYCTVLCTQPYPSRSIFLIQDLLIVRDGQRRQGLTLACIASARQLRVAGRLTCGPRSVSVALVILMSVPRGAAGWTGEEDRASTLPAPVDAGLASDDENDPLEDTDGDPAALQPPSGDRAAKYDPGWFKDGPEFFLDVGGGRRAVDWAKYIPEFSARMPAATKLPWKKEAADYKNTAWATNREWRGPKPGLNMEYWGNLRSGLAADDPLQTLPDFPTKEQILDPLWIKFHVLRPAFWSKLAAETDADQWRRLMQRPKRRKLETSRDTSRNENRFSYN